jgi:hypothetical protein
MPTFMPYNFSTTIHIAADRSIHTYEVEFIAYANAPEPRGGPCAAAERLPSATSNDSCQRAISCIAVCESIYVQIAAVHSPSK